MVLNTQELKIEDLKTSRANRVFKDNFESEIIETLNQEILKDNLSFSIAYVDVMSFYVGTLTDSYAIKSSIINKIRDMNKKGTISIKKCYGSKENLNFNL